MSNLLRRVQPVSRNFEYWEHQIKPSPKLVTPLEKSTLTVVLERVAERVFRDTGSFPELKMQAIEGVAAFKVKKTTAVPPTSKDFADMYDATSDPTIGKFYFNGECPSCGTDRPMCSVRSKNFQVDCQCHVCKNIFCAAAPEFPDQCEPPSNDDVSVFSDEVMNSDVFSAICEEVSARLQKEDPTKPAFIRCRPSISVTIEYQGRREIVQIDDLDESKLTNALTEKAMFLMRGASE